MPRGRHNGQEQLNAIAISNIVIDYSENNGERETSVNVALADGRVLKVNPASYGAGGDSVVGLSMQSHMVAALLAAYTTGTELSVTLDANGIIQAVTLSTS